jgi:hypothetical protein
MLPVLVLDPVPAPTSAIGAVSTFRYHTFQPHVTRGPEQLGADLALLEWRHEDALGPSAEQLSQIRLAQVQRQPAEVVPVVG